MSNKEKQSEFYIGDTSYLTMKTSTIIEMRDHLRLIIGDDDRISLDVSIRADFEGIPPEYHQIFCQMMSVRYGGIVNVWDNTQPFAKPDIKNKKWYQFWKSN